MIHPMTQKKPPARFGWTFTWLAAPVTMVKNNVKKSRNYHYDQPNLICL